MRLITAKLAAIGVAVLPLDPHETYTATGIVTFTSQDVNSITGQVDATYADLGANIPVTYSQTTTNITVTFPAANPHRLGATADYCTLSGTGIVGVDGTWPVGSITNATVVVLVSQTSQTKSGNAIAVPLKFAQTILATGSMTAATVLPTLSAALPLHLMPYSALILKVTAWTAGTAYLDVRQSGNGS